MLTKCREGGKVKRSIYPIELLRQVFYVLSHSASVKNIGLINSTSSTTISTVLAQH